MIEGYKVKLKTIYKRVNRYVVIALSEYIYVCLCGILYEERTDVVKLKTTTNLELYYVELGRCISQLKHTHRNINLNILFIIKYCWLLLFMGVCVRERVIHLHLTQLYAYFIMVFCGSLILMMHHVPFPFFLLLFQPYSQCWLKSL